MKRWILPFAAVIAACTPPPARAPDPLRASPPSPPPADPPAPTVAAPVEQAGGDPDRDPWGDAPRPEYDAAATALDRELAAAYAARRRDGASSTSTSTMRDLRERAEKLRGESATIGIAGDFVAALPGGLRIVTGDSGATVLDPKSRPVGWFDISRSTAICPPCGPNAKTIVAIPLASKLVALVPQQHGGGILVDVETMRTVMPVPADLGAIVILPGRTQLAFVTMEHDGHACRGHLTVASSDGTTQRRGPFLAPKDFCQGRIDVSSRKGTLVVSSAWSDELLLVDVASARASSTKRPAAHKDDPHSHATRLLCGRDREKVQASACTVGSRWVFPADVCAGAPPAPEGDREAVCSPGFLGL